jgi:hypothetical protein
VLITIKAGGVMKKTIFPSIAFSLILVIIYYGVQIGWGYYMTLNYVPDIINSYKSVDHLQQTISFGVKSTNRTITLLHLYKHEALDPEGKNVNSEAVSVLSTNEK